MEEQGNVTKVAMAARSDGGSASDDNGGEPAGGEPAGAAESQIVPLFQKMLEDFECEHCGHAQEGTGYTNHCECCLWSKHVDVNPGDRAALATCGGLMEPVAIATKKGAHRVLQRCVECEHERWNKTQEYDDFEAILRISTLSTASRGGGGGSGGGKGGRGDKKGWKSMGKAGDKGKGKGGNGKHSKGSRNKCLLKGRR